MSRIGSALFLITMVIVIVGGDVAFLRDHFWLRRFCNVGIVLIFGAVYLRWFRG